MISLVVAEMSESMHKNMINECAAKAWCSASAGAVDVMCW